MGDKSVQKRQFIIQKAREVFIDKGFKDVTMKDIVEACEISRGGLYLYFASTKEIFEAVLQLDAEESENIFRGNIPEDATPADVFAIFLKEQKKEIISKKSMLTIAIYEFFFTYKVPKGKNRLRSQFDIACKVIESLICSGIDSGEFYCENPAAMAKNIMYILEGMKISAQTMFISEKMVNEQMLFIMKNLLLEE
jgi:AcrR family transcriptional regulator